MPAAITIPQRLDRSVRVWAGEPGAAWLAALPAVIDACLDRWQLTVERVLEPGGRMSVVVYVRRPDGSPAVLKVSLVTPETAQEHAALAHWGGRGAVRLLDRDVTPDRAVLLLERLHGDISLRSLPEAKAMLEAAGILQRLWTDPPADHPFRTLAEHAGALRDALALRRDLASATVAEALPLIDEALEVSASLLATESERVVLHGDFHHANVLAGDRLPWLAIDPRPLVGERAWDLAWLAHDRMETLLGSPGPEAAVRRRLHRLADSLEVDRERLRGWTLFRTVEAGVRSLSVGETAAAELFLEFAGRM